MRFGGKWCRSHALFSLINLDINKKNTLYTINIKYIKFRFNSRLSQI